MYILNFRNLSIGKILFCQGLFLFMLCASAFSNQNEVTGTRPVKKYLDLEECLVGNTKEQCRETFVKQTTKQAMKESAKKDDIVLYVWMEAD